MNTGFLGPAVATALTVYGIETLIYFPISPTAFAAKLQQHLPFTVLKHRKILNTLVLITLLQQHLPFTVLKPLTVTAVTIYAAIVATALTVYGIETNSLVGNTEGESFKDSCNSTYRLRY